MNQPLLLDLFCGAGGCGEGYSRAGFLPVGCDINPKPLRHNPRECYVGDALAVLDTLLAGGEWQGYRLADFAAIHASPPCQDYSTGRNYGGRESRPHNYPRLIPPMRARLTATGMPWILENVMGAIGDFAYAVTICGTSLGLRVQRHRLFESSHMLFAPGPCRHRPFDVSVRRHRAEYLMAYHDAVTAKGKRVRRAPSCRIADAQAAMGIDWMPLEELGEAIPPAYTEWLGSQLMAAIQQAA